MKKLVGILTGIALLFSVTACTGKKENVKPSPPAQTNEQFIKEVFETAKKGEVVGCKNVHVGDKTPKEWSKMDLSKKRYDEELREALEGFEESYQSPDNETIACVNKGKIEMLISSSKNEKKIKVNEVKKVLGKPEKEDDKDIPTLLYQADKYGMVISLTEDEFCVILHSPEW